MKVAIANLKFPAGKNKLNVACDENDDNMLAEFQQGVNEEGVQTAVSSETSANLEDIDNPEENWMNKNSTATSQSILTLQKSKPIQRRSK